VFLLHKFEGLSHADIATRLGISKNMVEKHIIKALAHCRDRLHHAME
jgi:DNA-directed RNA polymerase specialized sigma24 family protein